MTLEVRLVGQGQYAVFEADRQISGRFGHDGAHARLSEIEAKRRKAAQRRTRPCLSCGTAIDSDGPHNRLCRPCGGRAALLGAQWS